ncbi:TPA_asm: X protein [finepatterned puffer bornavirus]|uniref:X protein n=1 Tax=finepatterned puffer bornavirus TaxID=3055758 RepID=A0AA48P906_9MONO|nr:TPA_asm: X protein [finepatterned puffer bornavirus]
MTIMSNRVKDILVSRLIKKLQVLNVGQEPRGESSDETSDSREEESESEEEERGQRAREEVHERPTPRVCRGGSPRDFPRTPGGRARFLVDSDSGAPEGSGRTAIGCEQSPVDSRRSIIPCRQAGSESDYRFPEPSGGITYVTRATSLIHAVANKKS